MLSTEEVVVDLDSWSVSIHAVFLTNAYCGWCTLPSRPHLVIVATLSECLSDIEQLIDAGNLLTSLIVCILSVGLQTSLVLAHCTAKALIKDILIDKWRRKHRRIIWVA